MLFQELNISKPILLALEEAGFELPTPIQEEVFSLSRSGRDIIGIAQTGTGKTLAYLIPTLMKLHYAQGNLPRALVIVPTRELVTQVCESVELLAEHLDIRCVGVYGGTNIRAQQQRVFAGVDLLVATPGRFMDIYLNGIIRTKLIKTVIVDEADRLMDLGFLPQLKRILEVIPEKHQTMFFSATFPPAVEVLASDFLSSPARIEVARQATLVDNVIQKRYNVPNITTKINLLKHLLVDKQQFRRVMIFTETKKNADRIVDRLADHWAGELSVIHSNKAQNTRLRALRSFKAGETRVMVASDVAARGIDVQDVSHVINFDIPSLPEEYIHRVGRTARAGRDGVALSLVSNKEKTRFDDIETLIGQQVPAEPLPREVEISDLLLDEERVETSNIVYQKKRAGDGAFHVKKAKNSYTAADNRANVKARRAARGQGKR
jgi:ATP-dependent RNA helicase RhlE